MQHFEFGNPDSRRVLLQPVDQHDLAGIQRETAELTRLAGPDYRLIALEIPDWNRDLSPWEAPPVFGREAFGGGAADTLAELLPLCSQPGRQYYLGGYSLAGLFALWAAARTPCFTGIAAASPSLWFPGFGDYLQAHPLLTQRVYLSLGDREERTRNPVMARVGDRIRDLHSLLQSRGTACVLEWNPGNHFRDPELRTARAFAWVLEAHTP